MKEVENIEDLVGEEISGVGFVMDYVEFYFSGPILRSLSNPMIEITDGDYRFPEPGSRDALCQLIGATVLAVKLEDGRSMRLETSNDRSLTVPLDDGSRRWAEAMHFVPRINGPIQVW